VGKHKQIFGKPGGMGKLQHPGRRNPGSKMADELEGLRKRKRKQSRNGPSLGGRIPEGRRGISTKRKKEREPDESTKSERQDERRKARRSRPKTGHRGNGKMWNDQQARREMLRLRGGGKSKERDPLDTLDLKVMGGQVNWRISRGK